MDQSLIPKFPFQPYMLAQFEGIDRILELPNFSGETWLLLERLHAPTAKEVCSNAPAA